MNTTLLVTMAEVSRMVALISSLDDSKYVSIETRAVILKAKGFQQRVGDGSYTVRVVN